MQGTDHQVTGQRCLNRNLRGLKVTHFPHHDDIGVLTKKGAQGLGKGHSHRFLHGHLHDTLDIKLHWVFDSQKLDPGFVDPAQTGVESRGLAATRGARHHKNTVRLLDDFLDILHDRFRKTQMLNPQIHR